MIKIYCLLFSFCFMHHAFSQQKIFIKETTIVKDSSGIVYTADAWKKLLLSGDYKLKPEDASNENTPFILVKLSDAEREKKLSGFPKPQESKSFATGEEIKNFSTTDINGNKIKLKDLKGKIVVLNFWFINCPPCRAEISELNKIVQEYKDSSNIVFLAVALDMKSDLNSFLRSYPFNYRIIDNGRYIASQYNVTEYPTHVIIDQSGKVYFHTIGAGRNIIHWLQKSITELFAAENSIK